MATQETLNSILNRAKKTAVREVKGKEQTLRHKFLQLHQDVSEWHKSELDALASLSTLLFGSRKVNNASWRTVKIDGKACEFQALDFSDNAERDFRIGAGYLEYTGHIVLFEFIQKGKTASEDFIQRYAVTRLHESVEVTQSNNLLEEWKPVRPGKELSTLYDVLKHTFESAQHANTAEANR